MLSRYFSITLSLSLSLSLSLFLSALQFSLTHYPFRKRSNNSFHSQMPHFPCVLLSHPQYCPGLFISTPLFISKNIFFQIFVEQRNFQMPALKRTQETKTIKILWFVEFWYKKASKGHCCCITCFLKWASFSLFLSFQYSWQ